jgi:putative SOS response-associated peptidase YedK
MCGRFVLHLDARALSAFGIARGEPVGPQYNVAPTQAIPVVIAGADGGRELRFMHWGLIPSWATDRTIGHRLVNARAETVDTAPAFRDAFRARRCLVLATAFYEWQAVPGARRKQPYAVKVAGGEAFAFAGLWEVWRPREGGEAVESCTIITCDANHVLAHVHKRMPVILPAERYDAWLNPATPATELRAMLAPYRDDAMHAYPVTAYVNSPTHEGPECIAPLVADS